MDKNSKVPVSSNMLESFIKKKKLACTSFRQKHDLFGVCTCLRDNDSEFLENFQPS